MSKQDVTGACVEAGAWTTQHEALSIGDLEAARDIRDDEVANLIKEDGRILAWPLRGVITVDTAWRPASMTTFTMDSTDDNH